MTLDGSRTNHTVLKESSHYSRVPFTHPCSWWFSFLKLQIIDLIGIFFFVVCGALLPALFALHSRRNQIFNRNYILLFETQSRSVLSPGSSEVHNEPKSSAGQKIPLPMHWLPLTCRSDCSNDVWDGFFYFFIY